MLKLLRAVLLVASIATAGNVFGQSSDPLGSGERAAYKKAVREMEGRTVVALRSNLLYDIVAAPNIGVEVPLGERFSVAGDLVFAYWHINNRYALQTFQGSVEGRYWFGRKDGRALTGWNAGLYATYCSRFDVQWGGGWQGDGYISTGIVGGYSLPIARSLNLDFSIAGGFFHSPEMRKYGAPEDGHLIWKETRFNVSRVALTQVRVNLVWLINKKASSK